MCFLPVFIEGYDSPSAIPTFNVKHHRLHHELLSKWETRQTIGQDGHEPKKSSPSVTDLHGLPFQIWIEWGVSYLSKDLDLFSFLKYD